MIRPSLTRHLLAWTLGALLLVWGSFVLIGYRTGMHESDELTDGHLASVASLVLSSGDWRFSPRPSPAALAGQSDLRNHDYQQSLSVYVWNASGAVVTQTGQAPQPAFSNEEGFATVLLGQPPAAWRSFSRWDGPAHQRKVMVLLSLQERDELAQDIAGQMTEPGLWLLPVIALVLGLAIRRGLRPLHALSSDVHALDIHHPAPLGAAHPQVEFRAVVESINTLAARYQAAMSRERELASELAHELRTPLASLTLQVRALREAPPGPQREQALAQMQHDVLRAGQVLSDLLSMARASRTALAEAARPLDLSELAQAVVGEFGQAAHESGHDLALASPGRLTVTGHAVLLGLALRNLLENALTHTPSGTRVEVQLDPDARWVQVCDSSPLSARGVGGGTGHARGGGPGLGLGLGHRVVGKIAAIHGAGFGSAEPPEGFTSCYRMTFPEERDQAPSQA